MCLFINTQTESRFVETVRIEQGRISHLSYHNARMNQTRKELFGLQTELDLSSVIHPEKYMERTKCRVEYAEEILTVEYAAYHIRPVHSLKLVQANTIDYTYKSTDRRCLTQAFSLRENDDDVLIVKNGFITDTSICNVALWNGECWLTPKHPLLKGTMRAALLDQKKIQAADIHVEDLPLFSRIRMFNAMIDFGEQECLL